LHFAIPFSVKHPKPSQFMVVVGGAGQFPAPSQALAPVMRPMSGWHPAWLQALPCGAHAQAPLPSQVPAHIACDPLHVIRGSIPAGTRLQVPVALAQL
jgi:hypothetical protein